MTAFTEAATAPDDRRGARPSRLPDVASDSLARRNRRPGIGSGSNRRPGMGSGCPEPAGATRSAGPKSGHPILFPSRIPTGIAALNGPEPWGRGVREG